MFKDTVTSLEVLVNKVEELKSKLMFLCSFSMPNLKCRLVKDKIVDSHQLYSADQWLLTGCPPTTRAPENDSFMDH